METVPKSDVDWAAYISTNKDLLPSTFTIHHTPLRAAIHHTIDHTLLALDASEAQVDALCAEASEWQFASVCVRLKHVARAVDNLKSDPNVGVACVVGFHEGMYETAEKEREAREAVRLGATELDMVLKYPLLKEGRFVDVYEDVLAVRKVAPAPVKLKVILETSQLMRDEVIAASVVSCMAGADFIKTSTGFNGAGASVENVALMRAVADLMGKGCKVKASGGVRSAEDCLKMLKAGADRIGTSSGVKIMKELAGSEVAEQGGSQGAY